MRIRIDLKIFIFFALFFITNQIKIYLTILFFCFVHELGHVFIGLLLGLKLEKLQIMPSGLTVSFKENLRYIDCRIKNANLLELKLLLTSIAGPLLSLILTIFFIYFDPIYISKQDAVYSNLLILFFNLLPIYPLDGGRIVKGILHICLGEFKAVKFTNVISNIFMIIITMICSVSVLYLKNIAIVLICAFLWFITIQENKNYLFNKV